MIQQKISIYHFYATKHKAKIKALGTQVYELDKLVYKNIAINQIPLRFSSLITLSDYFLKSLYLKQPIDKALSYNNLFEEYLTEDGICNFATLLIAKEALKNNFSFITIDGDVNAKNFLFFNGNVHIKGNLIFDGYFYVTGDLIVDGIIKDYEEWSKLLVGGNISASGIDNGSQTICAGNITTSLFVIDGTGKLLVGGGLSCKLLTEEGYEHDIQGKVLAEHHLNFVEDKIESMKKLENLIDAYYLKPIKKSFDNNEEDFYFHADSLLKEVAKQKNIWI